ncbi:MAG: hypothetical protein PHR69_03005 [Sphaerochaeta sp.]|nr:hypothetical protein [Sphaerochaeta sp.]
MGFELLLPVVLFILTLIIIFLLRSDDKRNQRADLIKKRAQNLLKNVENSQTQFKESAQKVEERISKKIDESHLLMSHVDSQLADLEARSDDLTALQKVLITYQASLTQLEGATVQVEQRVAVMKAEVAKLTRVQESLDDFDLRFEQFKGNLEKQITDGEDAMQSQQLKFKELQSASFSKLQEYEREVRQAEQDTLAQMAVHAETLKTRQDASLNLVAAQVDKLRQLREEGDRQLLLHEKAFQSAQRQANEHLQGQQREFAQLQARHAEQQKNHEAELRSIEDEALHHLTEEMQVFVQKCYGEMAQIFEMTLKKTDISFQNMIKVVSQYLKELSLRLEQARGVVTLLDTSKRTSLLEFKEELDSLLEGTLKGEQNLKNMQDMEEKASSALALLHQDGQQLQESLDTMKKEKLALLKKAETPLESVVFAMALVDEACKPLEKVDEPPAEEEAPVEEPETEKGEPTAGEAPIEEAETVKNEDGDAVDKEKKSLAEKRHIEYLSESEEEILLDEDEDVTL